VKISKEIKTGIVVVVAVALAVYGINFLRGTDLFKKDFTLYALYTKADGVIEANPVLVNGYRVGQVHKLKLVQRNGEYKVLVSFLLYEKVSIPKGSRAKITSSDLLGSKAVEIGFSDSKEFVHDGDTLLPDIEDDLKTSVDKRIAPLQKKAENLISSIDSVMQVVQQVLNANVRQNLISSFESIKNTITYLQHTALNLDTLTSTQKSKIVLILDKVQSITANVERSNEKLTNIINNFSNISDSLAKSHIKDSLKATFFNIIKHDSIFNNLNKASEDLDKLLKDLRINPERYVHISVFGRKDRSKPKD
jgi:phospholipid/cholesterol/gamma-HCH transport system substrate-binding protein